MELLGYVLAMYSVGNVPLQLSVPTYMASRRHEVDPVTLGAYLISEHRGDYPRDRCSPVGACGVFQLTSLWPRHFGYPLEARFEVSAAADMAARLVVYSQTVHAARGERGHDWRAHLKCAPGGRDTCDEPVDAWLDVEDALRETVRAIQGDEPQS